jgi:putative ABC transport system permease protein
VPDAAFPLKVTVDGRTVLGADDAPVIGHGWASAALAPFTLRDGTAPAKGSVVVDADLAARAGLTIGDQLTVTTKTGDHRVTVAGVAAEHLAGQGALFVEDAAVTGVSGLTAAGGPVLVRPLTAIAGRLARLGGASAWLAGTNSRAQARRVAAVAVPLVLLFGITATMLLTGALSEDVVARESAARNAAATVRVGDPAGISPAAAGELAATPGVTGAATTIPTRAILVTGGKPEDYPAQGLATTGAAVLDLAVRTGELGGAGTFAASATLARSQRWTVGDDVKLWLADGTETSLRLSAVYERARGFGDLVLPASLVAAHDPRGLVSSVYLRTDDEAVANRIRATWSAATTPPARDASTQEAAWELLVAIALVFTAVAVINTFAIATVGRRNEYAALRLTGATVAQVRRMVTVEAAIAVAVALVLGVLVTSIVVGAFGLAQDGGLHLIVDPLRYAALVGPVVILGLFAGAVPIRAVVRGQAAGRV